MGPGESGTVWYLVIAGGFTGFVKQVYIQYFENTWFEFLIDGGPAEPRVDHQIGTLTSPKVYDPELIAHKWVRVIAHNESSLTHVFEAIIDGELCKPK